MKSRRSCARRQRRRFSIRRCRPRWPASTPTLGDAPRCRTAFEALTADDFAPIPFDDTWVLTMGLLGHACAFLRDTQRAAILHERLAPYAHRNQVAPLEASLGSAARPLGELAATLGDYGSRRELVRARG